MTMSVNPKTPVLDVLRDVRTLAARYDGSDLVESPLAAHGALVDAIEGLALVCERLAWEVGIQADPAGTPHKTF
jgi:hypothetical protein